MPRKKKGMTPERWALVLKQIEKALAKVGAEQAAEIRKRYREQEKVIFVKTYTVHAHLRPVRPRKVQLQVISGGKT